MVWIKREYRSYKGFRYVWVPETPKITVLDETALNRPRAYTTEYAKSHNKGIRSRQYKNPKSAICVMSPNGNFCKIVNLRVEQIPLKLKAEFLKSLGITEVYCDSRNLGLNKYGIETKLIPKRKNPLERLFGYKSAIHRLPSNTPYETVIQKHMEYLSKLFTIIS